MLNPLSLIRNEIMTRAAALSRWLDPRRNIDQECGHPAAITAQDCHELYKRGDIARRVVRIEPDETWSQRPDIYETEDEKVTEFEQAWIDLEKKLNLFAFLQRADVLSGIGRYGILLLGFDDGAPMSEPLASIPETGVVNPDVAPPTSTSQLIYARPFEEVLLKINELEPDIKNPRYGMPKRYGITFTDSLLGGESGNQVRDVHWSRVIHLADNRMNSEVFGQPRMEVVFNRILDLRKIAGGSGEMFWKGGFPGLSLESLPTTMGEEIDFDEEKTKQQMEDYQNGLQRYLATIGMTVKSLSVQVADPGPHIEAQLRLIAAAMAVPWRVFIGSEAAQLASEQDSKAWNRRLTRRRDDYVSAFILRPLVDRLIAAGALPSPTEGPDKYVIDWPDLDAPSDQEKADNAQKKTMAIKDYVTAGADVLIPPFHFLTTVLDYDQDEAESILKESSDQQALLADVAATSAADNAPEPTPAEKAMQKAQLKAIQQGGKANGAPKPFARK